MAATGSEAVMIELMKDGWDWIKSEKFHKMEQEKAKRREANNPMKSCVLKFDHFENIHRLPKDAPTVDGAPNLRQVPGYLVFGTGQPTKSGFQGSLETIMASKGVNDVSPSKVLWTNMRQEPVVYMNGQSFTPRLSDKMNENMEFPGATGEDIEWLQDSFVSTIFKRIADQKEDRSVPKEDKGKVKYYRDTYAEHPDDRVNIEYTVPLDNDEALVTLSGMYDQVRAETGFNLEYCRLPIVDEKAPSEKDFDDILTILRSQAGPDTACVFNCQMGKGRTTTGMILACLVKDILFGDPDKTYYVDDTLNPDDFDEDELMEEKAKRGQFSIVYKVFEFLPEAKEAKAHLDKVIDLCGTPPMGTGLQNLRECIQWTQQKHDFEPKRKKPFWKQMSKNFIERYLYLILFTTYCKLYAPRGFDWTFTMWMDCRAELREVVYHGKNNFNWD